MGGRPSQSLALGQTPPAPPFQGQHVPPTLGVSRPLPRCSAAPAQAALCLLGRARVPHCEWLSCLPRAPGPLDHHCHTGPTPRPCLGPTADVPETCSRCPFASHWLLSLAEELTPGGGHAAACMGLPPGSSSPSVTALSPRVLSAKAVACHVPAENIQRHLEPPGESPALQCDVGALDTPAWVAGPGLWPWCPPVLSSGAARLRSTHLLEHSGLF